MACLKSSFLLEKAASDCLRVQMLRSACPARLAGCPLLGSGVGRNHKLPLINTVERHRRGRRVHTRANSSSAHSMPPIVEQAPPKHRPVQPMQHTYCRSPYHGRWIYRGFPLSDAGYGVARRREAILMMCILSESHRCGSSSEHPNNLVQRDVGLHVGMRLASAGVGHSDPGKGNPSEY